MSSERKIIANRRNAKRSTGPRTAKGKSRSQRNSWRHGLSLVLPSIFPPPPEIMGLANAIAGSDADPVRQHFATIAAEAEFELLRIQGVRRSLLASEMRDGSTMLDFERSSETIFEMLTDLNRLERYEQRAFSRRNRALELL